MKANMGPSQRNDFHIAYLLEEGECAIDDLAI